MSWDQLREVFEADGSLRDIYVLDTTLEDWDRLLEGLASTWPVQFYRGAVPSPLPPAEACFAGREDTSLLVVDIGGISVHAHFFTPDEIELDVSPREVDNPDAARRVLDLLRRVGRWVGKPVRLTPENMSDRPLVTYDPATGRLWPDLDHDTP